MNETITWHPLGLRANGREVLPDADTNVLLALLVDGQRDTCEGFLDGDQWRDVCADPLDDMHVVAWAHMPEGPV